MVGVTFGHYSTTVRQYVREDLVHFCCVLYRYGTMLVNESNQVGQCSLYQLATLNTSRFWDES
jgi:hypothetical protein